MAVNLGTAEGYLELDFSQLRQAATQTVRQLEAIDRQGNLVQSELRRMEAAAESTAGSVKGFGGMLQQAQQAASQLENRLQTARKTVAAYQDGIAKLTAHIDQSRQSQARLKDELAKAAAQQERAQQAVDGMAEAYRQAQKEIQAAAREYGEGSEQVQQLTRRHQELMDSYQQAQQTLQEHQDTIRQLDLRYEELENGIHESENRITEFRTRINETEAEISTLSGQLEQTRNKVRLFGSAAQQAGERWQASGEKLSRVGNALTLGVTTPLVAVGTAAVNAGNEFEAQMSRVSAIAGAYGDELEQLREQAIELGSATSFSATEAAQAMENLASAGFDTGEIMSAMPGMLDLAASSGEDLASSADIAASTLRGFQLEAGQAGHVADVLAKNAADTNAAIADTGLAMKYIAPVAQSAGWSLEEVAAAIGVLADAGIKGEQAGTTLRGALTRLMKPTSEMQAAMDALGVTFYDAQGKMKPLSTIVDELQKSTATLTDEQRDNRLATLFGTEALSGMKVLLSSSKTELDRMTDGLKNADGAARRMAETMLDNTSGSIEEMKGSLETAGITIQKQLAPWITKAADAVTGLANDFSELDEDTQGAILSIAGVAAAAGPVVKVFGTMKSGIGTVVSGFGKLLNTLGNTTKIAKSTKALSGLSAVGTKIPSWAGAAVVAAAALGVGIYVAFKKAEEAAIEANLEEHFGSVKLSAEEVEEVAKRLTTTDWTIRVEAYVEAKEVLEEAQQTLSDTIAALNKSRWKIAVGLELTQEEQDSYRQQLLDFAGQAQEYVAQQHYTSTVAVDAVFTPGTQVNESFQAFADSYYNGLDADLTQLGIELAELVNKAWEDGVLSAEEIDQLDEKQAQIQRKLDELSQARYDLTLDNLTADATKDGLTADSFVELMKGIREQLDQKAEEISDSKLELLVPWQAKLNNGEIDQEGFDLVKEMMERNADTRLGELQLEAVELEIGTIHGNYADELDAAAKTMFGDLNKAFEENADGIFTQESFTLVMSQIGTEMQNGFEEISDESKGAIREMLEEMSPEAQDLADLADEYREAGKAVPQGISAGLLDTYEMEVMAGNTDHIMEVVGAQLSQSDSFMDTVEQAADSGIEIPAALARGIYLGSGKVYDEGTKTWQQLTAATDESLPDILDYLNGQGMEPGNELADALAAGSGIVYDSAAGQWIAIQNAALDSQEDVTQILSACGISASDALVQAILSQEPNVRTQTVSLLSQLQSGAALSRGDLITLFSGLGYEVSDELLTALENQEPDAQGQMIDLLMQFANATDAEKPGLLQKMNELGVDLNAEAAEGLTEKKLPTPEVQKASSSDKSAARKIGESLYAAASAPFRVALKLTVAAGANAGAAALRGYATGGIVEQPQLAAVAEEGPESIIPLTASRRSSALRLWEETGARLGALPAAAAVVSSVSASARAARGMEDSGTLTVPVSVGIDYKRLAAALAAQLRESPIQLSPEIRVTTNPQFVVDGKEIAVTVAPEMDAQFGRLNKKRARGG